METMIERVARAIAPDAYIGAGFAGAGPAWERAKDRARAAIEAMREPTGAMRSQGGMASVTPMEGVWTQEIGEFTAAEAYQAMIDAALS